MKFLNLATDKKFANVVASYSPQKFLWLPFILGIIFIIVAFFKVWYRDKKQKFRL